MGQPRIECKSRFHLWLSVKYILYGFIKYVTLSYKGGKCGCFVLINKWHSWTQSEFTCSRVWQYLEVVLLFLGKPNAFSLHFSIYSSVYLCATDRKRLFVSPTDCCLFIFLDGSAHYFDDFLRKLTGHYRLMYGTVNNHPHYVSRNCKNPDEYNGTCTYIWYSG